MSADVRRLALQIHRRSSRHDHRRIAGESARSVFRRLRSGSGRFPTRSVPKRAMTPSALDNAGGWLARRAAAGGDRIALIEAERTLDYRALEARSARCAAWLRAAGVDRGDRVAIVLANRAAFLEAVFAAARLGAVALPINTRLAPPELREIFDDAEPRVLLHEAELEERIARACAGMPKPPQRLVVGGAPDAYEAALAAQAPDFAVAAVTPEDPMILMYTSGTTGVPKGALLPHRKTLANSLNAQLFFDCTRHDRVLVVVPLFHSFGLQILAIPALYAGASLVLQRHFDAAALWQAVADHDVTYFGGVPTMFRALLGALDAREDRSALTAKLRFAFTAGAAIPVELIHDFERRGLLLKQGFGQTETSILCCLDARDAVRKAGSVGKPVFHADVRVVRQQDLQGPSDTWREVAVGETGEIVVSRSDHDDGILETTRGQCRDAAGRRLAANGRPRDGRRRGLRHAGRSRARPVHIGRRKRLPGAGRGGLPAASRRRGDRGGRCARRALRGSGTRLRRAGAGRGARGGAAPGVGPRATRGLQGAAFLRRGGIATANGDGQGAEASTRLVRSWSCLPTKCHQGWLDPRDWQTLRVGLAHSLEIRTDAPEAWLVACSMNPCFVCRRRHRGSSPGMRISISKRIEVSPESRRKIHSVWRSMAEPSVTRIDPTRSPQRSRAAVRWA